MRLREVVDLLNMRNVAMLRARRARQLGIPGIETDVGIARRANRLLIRMLKGLSL